MENKGIWVVGVIAVIALALSAYQVGVGSNDQLQPIVITTDGQQLASGDDAMFGGSTRFPNSDLSAKTITANTTFTSTGAATFSGTATFSDDVTMDTDGLFLDASTDRLGIGTTTPAYPLVFDLGLTGTTTIASSQAGTSTSLFIYSFVSGEGGQIILEDNDGAGCTVISALNGTLITYTETCPTQ